MIEPDHRTPPMTPQLALRVAIVGSIALVLFALIFFRLWFLQVLSGSEYVADAQNNITRSVPVAAQRGEILASDGSVLVGSTPVPAVEILPPELPTPLTYQNFQTAMGRDDAVFNRLAEVLQMSTKPEPCKYTIYLPKSTRVPNGYLNHDPKLAQIPCLITQSIANQAYANVTIKTGVTADVEAYLAERQLDFPGVTTQQVYLRSYPYGSLGAQMFGTVGPITAPERALEEKGQGFKGAQATDVVGQSGLEYEYDQYLLGIDGTERVKVNAADQFEGYANETQPTPGYNLKTSLDLKLEQVGDKALQQAISDNPRATSGAFLAMDPDNGQVYAMGSLPSYNANIFTHPISTQTYDKDFLSANSNEPLLNRAIDGPLPDGSTFKVITATAALESHVWSLGDVFDDEAPFCMGTGPTALCLQNSGGAHYGALDLQTAIQVSDDEFFYNLGKLMDVDKGNGGALQAWAKNFGIGQTTGVDLPGEANGEVGSPKLQTELWNDELECQNATGPYAYTNAQGLISGKKLPGYKRSPKVPAVMSSYGDAVLSGGCGIASASYWTEGDNVETGVGQYDDQVTPLQLAVVYAAIENGGTIVTPHIGDDIESPNGTILQKIDPTPKRNLKINQTYLDAIRQGLHEAAQTPGGTSYAVMDNFPLPVYGKTGTAELGDSASSPEHAWYVCYVPASATRKPIVIVVNVEKGGFGAVAAAPVAREILSQWFLGKSGPYIAGSSSGDQT
jgi:penicillin-binding protein 2